MIRRLEKKIESREGRNNEKKCYKAGMYSCMISKHNVIVLIHFYLSTNRWNRNGEQWQNKFTTSYNELKYLKRGREAFHILRNKNVSEYMQVRDF